MKNKLELKQTLYRHDLEMLRLVQLSKFVYVTLTEYQKVSITLTWYLHAGSSINNGSGMAIDPEYHGSKNDFLLLCNTV